MPLTNRAWFRRVRRSKAVGVGLLSVLTIGCRPSDSARVVGIDAATESTSLDCSGGYSPSGPLPMVTGHSMGPRITTSEFDGIVVPAAGAEGSWTPTREDAEALEASLSRFLGEQGDRILDDLPRYKRQYAGYTEGDARRMVALFLYETTSEVTGGNWLEAQIGVAGGGSCYLRAWFDPESRQLLGFQVNAPL